MNFSGLLVTEITFNSFTPVRSFITIKIVQGLFAEVGKEIIRTTFEEVSEMAGWIHSDDQ